LSWFITPNGEAIFAVGVNYPLKVAGFDLALPGWFCPADDIEQFDLGSFQPTREPHQQISVRIAGKQRVDLTKAAKRKDASVGELIRAALEQLSEKPARAGKTVRPR
jgi:hypothetical protein